MPACSIEAVLTERNRVDGDMALVLLDCSTLAVRG